MSELASTTERVTVDVCVPSTRSSSTPVTVIVWAVSQFAAVNVRVAGEIVISPVSEEATVMTTSEVGWASKTTVMRSVDPPSVTVDDPSVCVILNPAVSSSAVETETV